MKDEISKHLMCEAATSFGLVAVYFDPGDTQRFQQWRHYNIPPQELLQPEAESHITVKYGLHIEDPEEVARIIRQFGKGIIEVILGVISIFPDSGDGEVVKIEVHSKDLQRLNALISEDTRCTDTHPEYKPHCTLAYVRPGCGNKYIGDRSFYGKAFMFRTVVFSDKNEKKAIIRL